MPTGCSILNTCAKRQRFGPWRLVTKYPNIRVLLADVDGRPFAILGQIQRTMRKAGVPPEEISAFLREALSNDYDNLLQTCIDWLDAR